MSRETVPETPRETLAVRFANELRRCSFPPAGSPVTCAVSGGADSSALLILAVASGCHATAVHVDHGLRSGSADEVSVVKDLCERLGARFVAKHVVVDDGPNLEARARDARYGVLPAEVLVGHTADDQAETMVLNLMRGAGVDGMAGMRADQNRPLLRLRRSDTEAVCERFGYAPLADPMNDETRFRRVRVRQELLPLLSEIADRDVVEVLARQAQLFADDADVLDALAREVDPTDAPAVAALPPAIARRAIRMFLRAGPAATHPPDLGAVDRVLAVARGEAVGTDVGSGWRVQRTQQRLRLIRTGDLGERHEG